MCTRRGVTNKVSMDPPLVSIFAVSVSALIFGNHISSATTRMDERVKRACTSAAGSISRRGDVDRNPSSLAKTTYKEPAFKSFPQKEWWHRWPSVRIAGVEYYGWSGRQYAQITR